MRARIVVKGRYSWLEFMVGITREYSTVLDEPRLGVDRLAHKPHPRRPVPLPGQYLEPNDPLEIEKQCAKITPTVCAEQLRAVRTRFGEQSPNTTDGTRIRTGCAWAATGSVRTRISTSVDKIVEPMGDCNGGDRLVH